MREQRLCRRLHIALRVGGEQQHFEQLVIGQALGPGGDHPLAQPAAMAVIMRHSGHRFGELVPAVPHGVRERQPSRPCRFPARPVPYISRHSDLTRS